MQIEYPLSINKLKESFFFLKTNKSEGHDQISFNVIKNYFRSLLKPFRLSLERGIFQDKSQIYSYFLRLVMKINSATTKQSLSYLVFLKYLNQSCIEDFSIICQNTIYFIKSSLVFSKATRQNML